MRLRLKGICCAAIIITCAALALYIRSPDAVQPASTRGKSLIIIDAHNLTLSLYENDELVKRYPVAIGAYGMSTPLGVFYINKRYVPKSADMGTRFLGLSVPWGVYGVHGTSNPGSIGHAASHGCIRMYNRDVEDLYKRVYVGTPVIIESGPYGELGDQLKPLSFDDRGSQVRAVQRRLLALGYDPGGTDGTFGPGTRRALLRFKRDHGLPPTEIVDDATYRALGIMLFE
ncbi:MAG: L,D-transpeptidase family protein [Oscillospiraceae bacterium]|jgi:hypothetical protein|nr:L,D-transpeptidase family protein [Oscillospiraceae bacterium]